MCGDGEKQKRILVKLRHSGWHFGVGSTRLETLAGKRAERGGQTTKVTGLNYKVNASLVSRNINLLVL